MAYSNQSDLLERINEDTLVQLTDTTASGQVDPALLNSSIADADALINSLVSPVYQVPLTVVPRVIRDHSATIAIFKLHLFRSIDPGVWKEAYAGSLAFLQAVAEGKIQLEGISTEPSPSANLSNALSFESEPRKFSRTKLKDW